MRRTRSILLPLATGLLALAPGGCTLTGSNGQAVDAYVRGQLLIDRGEYDQALAELKQAVQADPDLSVAHSALGDIHRHRGDYQAAITSYQEACRTDRYSYRPHYNLAVTYQFLADATKAVELAHDYLRKAVDTYLRALVIKPGDFDASLNLSACYFQLGKLDLAEQYCLQAVNTSSDRAEAWTNLGVIYDSLNRLDEAVRAYKQALEIDTHQPVVLLNLGSTYVRQGQLKHGLHAFQLAADLSPRDPAPWEQIGACSYHLGQFDEALKAFETAAGMDPNSPRAHRGLGVVYMRQFLDQPTKLDLRDKALAAWGTSLAHEPNQPDLLRLVERYRPTASQSSL